MKLLHVVATPREQKSNTLRISNAFLIYLQSKHVDLNIEVLDLFNQDLPAVAGDNIEAKYTCMVGAPIDKQHEESWKQIESLIEHFLSADIYLISTPMWNFGIPYALKYYIDAIVQPGYLFRYDETGQPRGMALGKKMVCITSRGGDYSEASPLHAFDFQEPYLRAIFNFIGITDMQFINAQPMDITQDLRETAIENAIKRAKEVVENTNWETDDVTESPANPRDMKPESIDSQ